VWIAEKFVAMDMTWRRREEKAEEADAHTNGRNIFESIMKDGVQRGDSKNRPL